MVTENKQRSKSKKPKKVSDFRYADYYDMQETFDGLCAKAKSGEAFDDLCDLIFSRDNILLAYRNIKGFFDNVDHAKLIRQMWALGIRDKCLIYIIKRILKAPIQSENGTTVAPAKGTPQGGIILPLLANIILNELDW